MSSDFDASQLEISTSQTEYLEQAVTHVSFSVIRNVSGYTLPTGTVEVDRQAVEAVFKDVFTSLPSTSYFSLSELDGNIAEELSSMKLLFEIPSAMSKLSGTICQCHLMPLYSCF